MKKALLPVHVFCFFVSAIFCIIIDECQASMHGLFTESLRPHVKEGKVDYKNLCKDGRLDKYISFLAKTDPQKLNSEKARLAFWINAYNAYTLKIICANYPLKSINSLHTGGLFIGSLIKSTVWDKKFVVIGGEKITLNFIEHKILRSGFKEPRIHFSISCAAKGCAPLRNEAYEEEKLDEQLIEQARIFLFQKEKNSFNLKQKAAYLSPIFGWYRKDFGKDPETFFGFISAFLPLETSAAIKNDPRAWKVRYTFYDWSLNE